MKKDTITITRAEYAQLNKAANAAVEHACELFQAARLVDELKEENAELKARVAELEKLALYLDKQSDAKTALIGQIIDDLAKAEDENEALKAKNTLLVQKANTWQTWYKNLNEYYRRFFSEWDIVPKN